MGTIWNGWRVCLESVKILVSRRSEMIVFDTFIHLTRLRDFFVVGLTIQLCSFNSMRAERCVLRGVAFVRLQGDNSCRFVVFVFGIQMRNISPPQRQAH